MTILNRLSRITNLSLWRKSARSRALRAFFGLALIVTLAPLSPRASAAVPQAAENPLDWAQFAHDPQRSNATPVQVDPPYCYAWKWYEVPFASRAQPVVADGRLYMGSMNGFMYARNATTGAALWSFNAGSPIRHSAAVYDRSVVIFTTHAGTTFGLNALNGNFLWARQTGPSSTAPLVDQVNSRVYAASSNGTLSALNATDGALLWAANLIQPILTTPALSADGSVIYLGNEAVQALAVSAANGSLLWRVALQGQSLSERSPVVAGGYVLYRSQPLEYFPNLLYEGDQQMDRAGSWASSWDANVWTADWGKVEPQIREHLITYPVRQTFFVLNASNGSLHPATPAPILYTYGNNDTPSQPVVSDRIYTPYRARHGIQTDSGSVHVMSKYDAELGALNPDNLSIQYLRSNVRLNTTVTESRTVWEFRMTSDEASQLTKGGNILWVDNWERLGGLNVVTNTPVHGSAVSNDWAECQGICGPGSYRTFFPMTPGTSSAIPNPRIMEGRQRPGAVIANDMVYWRVVEGGIGALTHQTTSPCPAPYVWAPGAVPPRPSAPESFNRPIEEYLTLDLTSPRHYSPDSPTVRQLRQEITDLVNGNTHFAPYFFQRGMSTPDLWPYTSNENFVLPKASFHERGSVVFHDPADLLLAAAQAYPYLDSALQSRLRAYMAAEMAHYPPLRDLPFFSSSSANDWLRNGLARESYNVHFRSELNNWPPARASLNGLYALWLWSKNTGDWSYARANWSQAQALYNNRRGVMLFASDLGGLIGYYRMASQLGYSSDASSARTTAINYMNMLRSNPQSYLSRADDLYRDPRNEATGWSAPALFGMTPEVGLFLREQTGGAYANYLINKEYGRDGNGLAWWYMTRVGIHAEVGESSFLSPLSAWSHFLGHAYLLGEPREDLSNYLDRPWGRADVYSIQKLAAVLQARPKTPNFSFSAVRALPPAAMNGAEVTLIADLINDGAPPEEAVSATMTLPAVFNVVPNSLVIDPAIGSGAQNGNTITWNGMFPESGRVTFSVRALVNTQVGTPTLHEINLLVQPPAQDLIQKRALFIANPRQVILGPVMRQ